MADVFLHGALWHDTGLHRLLSVDYVAGDWHLVGNNSLLEMSYTMQGLAPTAIEIAIERRDRDGDAVRCDAQTYQGDGEYNVHDRSYRTTLITGTHSLSVVVPRWSVVRILARRAGGDSTTAMMITGRAKSPDT